MTIPQQIILEMLQTRNLLEHYRTAVRDLHQYVEWQKQRIQALETGHPAMDPIFPLEATRNFE